MIRKLLTVMLLISIIMPATVSAHPVGSPCSPGSDTATVGYVVDCFNHQANASFNYRIDSGVTTLYSGYVTTGAANWNATGIVSISKSITSTSQGYVYTYTDPNTSYQATFGFITSDSNGHLISWTIMLNKSLMDGYSDAKNKEIATHEFGHAIGLNDLTNFSNSDKLMYSFSSRTASTPTTKDQNGAIEATKH
ncbi:zinc metalloprotease [Cohnella fermenti]|uniref:Peptidase M10 metallopeptidase domain-containing protein n=1 Tax=Cohnella fermenti TaxID=2565925 RepID=A0A4S4CA30_9BACL|nr:hypothetical protein [Cohnella fermenti]THF84246.1 hypothetical protein E6C55_02840 [Cohnella fermenti]